MELSISMIIFRTQWLFSYDQRIDMLVGLRETNVYQVMFRVMMDDVDSDLLLLFGARKILRIFCFIPGVR